MTISAINNVLARISLVILAGGQASRLGFPKGLFAVNGSFWLTETINKAKLLGFTKIIVVTGYHHSAYENALRQVAEVSVVQNINPEFGPFSSLQTGLNYVVRDENFVGVFVLPVDLALPCMESIASMLDVISKEQEIDALVPVVNISRLAFKTKNREAIIRRGHFLWLSPNLCKNIVNMNSLDTDARLDIILRNLPANKKVELPISDSRVFLNLNTKAEWSLFADLILKKPMEPLIANFKAAASSVVVVNDCLLTCRYINQVNNNIYFFLPSGDVSIMEQPRAAAAREFIAQTGLVPQLADSPIVVEYYFPGNNILYIVENSFFAGKISREDTLPETVNLVPQSDICNLFGFNKAVNDAVVALASNFSN